MSPSAAETYWNEAAIQGEARGIEKGEARGIEKGKAIGEANAIIRMLRRRVGEPPARLRNRIMSIQSIDKLDELLDFAFTCVSLGEFATALN
ncbi:MAG: DUF4351 domain-containing protein [Planctomycetaceae bacterium]|jgi:predicted transposase YdaD|nr:DUF4351 domain-containing protein [Planctomycetaceae bacterium]